MNEKDESIFTLPKTEKILDEKMDIFYNLPTGLHYNYGKFAGDDAGIADLQVPAFILDRGIVPSAEG